MEQIGRYRIEREVARGGSGAVYRALAPDGRAVALKLLLAGRSATPLQRRRFATEVQALLRLRHPHVVALLDAGEHEGAPFLVIEWIEGETLAARLARDGPLPWPTAIDLVRRLAEAMEHCHAQGVIHRDLKPGNVMLRASDGAALVADFGLSKDIYGDESLELQSALVRSVRGRWLGTPGYCPPEQARGDLEAIGLRSDVYGLGAILYAALTGKPPQAGESLVEVVAALDRAPDAPGRVRSAIPSWLDEVCRRALAPDPAARQASAAVLVYELVRGRAAMVAQAPVRRRRGWALALLLACATLAVVVRLGCHAPFDPSAAAEREAPIEPGSSTASLTSLDGQAPAIARAERGALGIQLVAEDIAQRLGVTDGVAVGAVIEGTGAARAGIEGVVQRGQRIILGDVIVAIDGQPIRTPEDLIACLQRCRPGQRVEVSLRRGAEEQTLLVELSSTGARGSEDGTPHGDR